MVTIRLQRRGRRKRPIHHIVVADSRAPRDGRIVEDLGRFNNLTAKNEVTLNEERAIYWLQQGAQPSNTVRSILKEEGVLYKMHLIRWGKSEEEIEEALNEWRENRAAKAEKTPTKKERQQAMLEAEEKEYQKQLKKKAEEAAKEKAKQEALAEEETETGEGKPESGKEVEEQEAEEIEAKVEETKEEEKAETKETEVEEKEAKTEETEAEVAEEEPAPEKQEKAKPETTEEEKAEEEVKKAEAKADEAEEEGKAAEQEAKAEEVEAETETKETEEETKAASDQVSTDMLAKEAIAHIENTPPDALKGFVPDDESRVTVQRAWKEKQEE